MSTLKRLFEYTASATVAPVENFTTEALAAAIRSDWSPIVGVLGSHGIVTPDTVLKVEPFTQYHVTDGAGSGFVDLVLQIATTDGPHEVWLENKVGAPESGRQLAFYAAVIRQHEGDGVKRHLVVLSPRPISHALLPSEARTGQSFEPTRTWFGSRSASSRCPSTQQSPQQSQCRLVPRGAAPCLSSTLSGGVANGA